METNRPFVHLSVHMQKRYLKVAHPELPDRVNRFAAELHDRGVPTIWCGACETNPPLMAATENPGLKLYEPDQQMVFQPNQGDLLCLNAGSSPLANIHLREHLRGLENPIVIVTGVLLTACVGATIADVTARQMSCIVPLELVSDFLEPGHAKNPRKFLAFNESAVLDIAGRTNPNLVSLGSGGHILGLLDGQNKRPAPSREPASFLRNDQA